MKRVISVALALLMVMSCFSIMASATITNAVLQVSIKPLSTNYNKGDVVSFQVCFETSEELGVLGCAKTLMLGYDSSVFETLQDFTTPVFGSSWETGDNATLIYEGYPVENNLDVTNSFLKTTTNQLNATDEAKGWDTVLHIGMTSVYGTTDAGTFCDDDYSTETVSFLVNLKIKEDASDTGSYVVGVTDYSIENNLMDIDEEVASVCGINGNDGESAGFVNSTLFSTVDATVEVTSASTGPVVDKSIAQVKMTPTSTETVEDEFKLRVISKITDSDYDTYFANSGDDTATANAITELGMVAYKGDSFDYDTAVAAAKGTAADGYAVGTTDYLSKKSDTADGTFGTIILLSHETCTNDVTYIGYVKYLDSEGAEAYAFYETSYTAAVSTNYTSIVSNYLKAYPYGA